MRKLSAREKRTVKLGAVALVAYLVLFYGMRTFRAAEAWRARYDEVELAGSTVERDILRERAKAHRLEKLRTRFRFDTDGQHPGTIVAGVRAKLHAKAQEVGLALGSSKESPGRADGRELAVLQLEGIGPTLSAVRFVDSLARLGHPLVVDWLEWKTGGMQPGQVRLSLGVVVWKYEPKAGASAAPPAPPAGAPPVPPAPAEISPRLQAIDKSGIFGLQPRNETPPALLGIAGAHAMIRSPSGKKGLLAEGQTFEDIKLLRLGTNRALVEHKGQVQELLLFAGLGGETLLPPNPGDRKDTAP